MTIKTQKLLRKNARRFSKQALKERAAEKKRELKRAQDPARPPEKKPAKPSHEQRIRTDARDAFKSHFGNKPSGRWEIF